MRTVGDIEMVYGDPKNSRRPVGLARLKEFVNNVNSHYELWFVEYLNNEGYTYEALLKKQTNGTNESTNE